MKKFVFRPALETYCGSFPKINCLSETRADTCIGDFFRREPKSALKCSVNSVSDAGCGWSWGACKHMLLILMCLNIMFHFSKIFFISFACANFGVSFAAVFGSLLGPRLGFHLPGFQHSLRCAFRNAFWCHIMKRIQREHMQHSIHYFEIPGNLKLDLPFDIMLILIRHVAHPPFPSREGTWPFCWLVTLSRKICIGSIVYPA